ncbi:hypothetical protein [Pantoea sp. Nvir]|uniref:hypothetical protein n=1 Tax=Pantoea sp. Nvir TaxID=2576760 RepID=UPI001357FF74|nr:hypothetical protein [Pantoea sp. Nvir]CAJ0990805.1 Bifunctional glutamine synthetase adenylyltransferase/adenylyl-removing enzyme [Pantoea sp. Nvir]
MDEGGITDIALIAQYLVLRYVDEQLELTCCSYNVRIFKLVARYAMIKCFN